jgi:hypothetical protein
MSAKLKPAALLSHRLRTILPEPCKRVLRGVKLALSPIPDQAPNIPQNLLDSCRIITSRDDLLSHLPAGGVIAEIGTLHGDFSRKILRVCTPKTLHLIDLNTDQLDADVREHPSVTLHQGNSAALIKALPDQSLDWAYIDGDHTYAGVKADINAVMDKIKPGGYIVFNDFARIAATGLGTFGVHQAVCEFAAAHQWPFAFFCLQPQALYDVALQKPQ